MSEQGQQLSLQQRRRIRGPANTPKRPKLDIYNQLDVVRAGAYGLALSLLAIWGEKSAAPWTLGFTTAAFFFIFFDGFLRYYMRDSHLRKVLPARTKGVVLVLLILFAIEVAGLFFVCGFAADFVVWKHLSENRGLTNYAIFCFLAAAHNLVYLGVLACVAAPPTETQEAEGASGGFLVSWKLFWLRTSLSRILSLVLVYPITTLLGDAKESWLLGGNPTLWVAKLSRIEEWFEARIPKIDTSKNHLALLKPLIVLGKYLPRCIVHCLTQLVALHIIGFNLVFGMLLLFAVADGRWTSANYLGVRWWITSAVVAFLAYYVTSYMEKERVDKKSQEVGWLERVAQFVGNAGVVSTLVAVVVSLKEQDVMWVVLVTQVAVMLLQGYGTTFRLQTRRALEGSDTI